MRIITGIARGRRLQTPEGMDVRPTTEKVKESLFSIIQFELEGRRVLDLFAGSGQLGLEALSRGASYAVFVDSAKRSMDVVRKNISATGMGDKCKTVPGDAFSFLESTGEQFDVVFMDPPYENGMCDRAAQLLPAVLKPTSIVICETRANESLPDFIGNLPKEKEYRYGAIKLTLYRQ